ncbi:GspE/PulE family protein [Pseudidiomarina sp. CB1]|uniref:GspE/PulE family protein n=1 Tax=Pseudidiomarina sp. CB1 TaxID=2972484 RepID=UPI0021625B93|nr:ATPase, T2SS/T4P/T4SS family [Pseudidiomarina sp. CB1]
MRYITDTEWQAAIADEFYLQECVGLTETASEEGTAVVVTTEGYLIASRDSWRRDSIALLRLQEELQARQAFRQQLLGDAREIRRFLHDAEATRAQRLRQHDEPTFDRTRAQQALEDLVTQALVLEASDIHLVFDARHASLAFRVHGRLVGHLERPREILVAAIAAALNTSSDDFHELFDEQRLSSASINVVVALHGEPQRIRLRVQKSPTRNGFAVTMRVQIERQQILRLQDLGVAADLIAQLHLLLEQPRGMLLIAGPTGQGKTTTLAALNLMIPPDHKIISLEDPIEIIQPHIEQKPVIADHAELNFANMVKVALREDPDVISISEIRDSKTAQAAYTAALTGHLVTATVHAHDCFGVLQRLHDLGLAYEMLAQPGVIRGVLAQRLLKQDCQHCASWVLDDRTACPKCQGTKAGKRQFVGEYLDVNDGLRRALRSNMLDDYRAELISHGWKPLDQQLQEAKECQMESHSSRCG